MLRRSLIAGLIFLTSLFGTTATQAALESEMTTPTGASATVRIIITITTALGTSTDDDTRTMTTTGTAQAAFLPSGVPVNQSQFNAVNVAFSDTTFVFNFFCLPFIGCQTLNVAVSDLRMTLIEPDCSAIDVNGGVAFPSAVVNMSGSYVATGVAAASGSFDQTGAGALNARITTPDAKTVVLDQLTIAEQVIEVDPVSLPSGVTALTIVIQPNFANTTFTGTLALATQDYDADHDNILDACDACTDTDGDGFGDPNFIHNLCAIDNCPDVFNPDQTDSNGNGIGDACETPVCAADVTGDNLVNVSDLLSVINAWGMCQQPCPPTCAADINSDCAVNVTDLLGVINGWGMCPQ